MRHAPRTLSLILLACFGGIAFGGGGEHPGSPKAAFEAMQKEIADARKARDYTKAREIQTERSSEFLDAWQGHGAEAEGEEILYLARIYGLAQRHWQAMDTYERCSGVEELPMRTRVEAMAGHGKSLYLVIREGDYDPIDTPAILERSEAFLAAMVGEEFAASRSKHRLNLARCREELGDKDEALDHYLTAAREKPSSAYGISRSVMPALMAGVHDLDAYDGLRKRGAELAGELRSIYGTHVAALVKKGDEKAVGKAKGYLVRMESMTKPLEMLGKPAPEWTLLRAYGGTKALADHRGKVVVVDFWATWCGWCIKSFPAVRDLLRDYADRDLVLVGATAPASYVVDQNFRLDADLEKKAAKAGAPKAHRLPRDAEAAAIAKFRAEEQEVIARFIANHEMTWDVVMIDGSEPGAKYALTGWPHAVVVDRQGRVRYFKKGALLRDRPKAVQRFREVIDALLKEGD